TTKFCLCPCSHCALKPNLLSDSSVCQVLDGLIPKELKEELKRRMEPFEKVPDEKKDWHPGSNNQVLDLIHPSLYCYVKNVSEVNIPPNENIPVKTQVKYKWLPAEFEVLDKENGKVKIKSYINNVDEKVHKGLYETIEKIFGFFLKPLSKLVRFDKRLQVIVKAANIVLTPDLPYYFGGTWHTEGTPD